MDTQERKNNYAKLNFYFYINNGFHDYMSLKVICSNEPTENHNPTLQFPSALQTVLASFWFTLTALIT